MILFATYPFSAELEPAMSWLQFSVAMTGHLAWPLVVLILLYVLRKQLGSLAERILELSFGGATVKFGNLLSKGSDIIDESPALATIAPPEPEHPAQQKVRPQIDLPDQPPESNLLERYNRFLLHRDAIDDTATSQSIAIRRVFAAFDTLEGILDQAGEALGVKNRGPGLIQTLWRRNLIGTDVANLYRSLRAARNAMAHGKAELPNEAECLEFVRQASYLSTILLATLETIKEKKGK